MILQSLLRWTHTSSLNTPHASWPTESYTELTPVCPCHFSVGCSKEHVCGCSLHCHLTCAKSMGRIVSLTARHNYWGETLVLQVPLAKPAAHFLQQVIQVAIVSASSFQCLFSCQVSCHFPPLPQHVFTTPSYVIFETSWNINAQSWRTNKMVAFKKLTDEILLCASYLLKSGSLPPLKPAENFKYLTTASDRTRCGTSFPWETCGIPIMLSIQFRHTLLF